MRGIVWLCLLAAALGACGSSPVILHGTTTAGGCTVCPADGGAYFDSCGIVGSYTYYCVGVDAGAGCASGSCQTSCSSDLDCPFKSSCTSVPTPYGHQKVCN